VTRGSNDEDLNSPLNGPGLTPAVEERRRIMWSEQEGLKSDFETRIAAHIDAHRRALKLLRATHQWIADSFDFDLTGDTRQAAMWEMQGRCLGIAFLILDSLEGGYTAEVLHLGRAVHESNRLLSVFHMPGEDALLRKWLRGEYVTPAEARQAEERFDTFLAQAMKEQGIGHMTVSREGLSRELYSNLSEATHHRRRWVQDTVFDAERVMLVGPVDHWVRRGATTGTLVAVVEETVIAVGDSQSQFIADRSWYANRVKPFIESFEALRTSLPLV
jgi:hypothetical protein